MQRTPNYCSTFAGEHLPAEGYYYAPESYTNFDMLRMIQENQMKLENEIKEKYRYKKKLQQQKLNSVASGNSSNNATTSSGSSKLPSWFWWFPVIVVFVVLCAWMVWMILRIDKRLDLLEKSTPAYPSNAPLYYVAQASP